MDLLAEQGVAAVPYHARMDARARLRNQERWMSDEVRVLVGTIAFGLGINKAAVRAVIHLSLPKRWSSTIRRPGGRAGIACRRIARSSGGRRTWGCWRTSSSRSRTRMRSSVPGIATM